MFNSFEASERSLESKSEDTSAEWSAGEQAAESEGKGQELEDDIQHQGRKPRGEK